MLDEARKRYRDHPAALEGLQWSLTVIARIMLQVIDEGSSTLITAVVLNQPKAAKKALGDICRRDRATMSL